MAIAPNVDCVTPDQVSLTLYDPKLHSPVISQAKLQRSVLLMPWWNRSDAHADRELHVPKCGPDALYTSPDTYDNVSARAIRGHMWSLTWKGSLDICEQCISRSGQSDLIDIQHYVNETLLDIIAGNAPHRSETADAWAGVELHCPHMSEDRVCPASHILKRQNTKLHSSHLRTLEEPVYVSLAYSYYLLKFDSIRLLQRNQNKGWLIS